MIINLIKRINKIFPTFFIFTILLSSCGKKSSLVVSIPEQTENSENNNTDTNAVYSLYVTVNGVSGETLIINNNGSNDLTVSQDGNYLISSTLPKNQIYLVSVKDVPLGQTCAVTTGGSGTISGDVTEIVQCSNTSVSALYTNNGAKWNDYVSNNANTIFEATDDACLDTLEPGAKGPYACIHGGEIRKVPLYGRTSCNNITAEDALGVFEWSCSEGSDALNDPAIAVSYRIKDNKALGDLIDTTPEWRNNSVTVYENSSNIIARTALTNTWWENPILTYSGLANDPSTIYIVSSDSSQITIDADHVALVVRDNTTISDNEHLIYSDGKKYFWVEGGNYEIIDNFTGLFIRNSSFVVLRNINLTNQFLLDYSCLAIENTSRSRFENLKLQDCWGRTSVDIYTNSNYNLFRNILSANSAYGIASLGKRNKFSNIRTYNNSLYGINIEAADTIAVNVISTNNDEIGVVVSDNSFVSNVTSSNGDITGGTVSGNFVVHESTNATVQNISVVNSDEIGFIINNSSGTTVSNVAVSHTTNVGIYLTNANYNYFTNNIKIGNQSGFTCQYISGTLAGLDSNCDLNGTSDANVAENANLSSSFVGKVYSDINNIADTSGWANYDSNLVSTQNWTLFDNEYRTWGLDGDAFPDSTNIGHCQTGASPNSDCRIWDWSINSDDTEIRNINSDIPNGNNVGYHIWSAANQSDCEDNIGATWGSGLCSLPGYDNETDCNNGPAGAGDWATNKCYSVYLYNAVEVWGDLIGNDNFLCESGEVCILSPNIGAYQGHGNIVSAGTFTSGIISNVTLLKYETNGY